MKDILQEICTAKREHVRKSKMQRNESTLLREAMEQSAPRGFIAALRAKLMAGEYGLIAEIKKASPSKGIIREDFQPAAHAGAYAEGGAACLSVLTDTPYFQGEDAYVAEARAACALPLLRKDFMLEPYQIIESRALGADCVLLIMAALTGAQAQELLACADSLGMDALIEVHDERELDNALTHLPARMVGINNRSLHTFETTLQTSETLAKMLPAAILGVSESGIFTHADVQRLSGFGLRCFLVGESLMRERDIARATRALLGC